jgi:hypothetical protein
MGANVLGDMTTITESSASRKSREKQRTALPPRLFAPAATFAFTQHLFDDDVHTKRVKSIANAVTGLLRCAVMSIHAIGRGYAQVAHVEAKSGVKMVDRLLSNPGIRLDVIAPAWVQWVVGPRREIAVALDWTDFDDDDHTTLAMYLVTRHGRATPLLWRTVLKSELAGQRTRCEHEMVEQMHAILHEDVRVTLLADRGFGDQKMYDLLQALGWDFAIRFRECIKIEQKDGVCTSASELVLAGGRALMVHDVKVTRDRCPVPAVVIVRAKKMKEAWCLATTLTERTAREVVDLYAKRFTIEETFRDQKDLHFGMGLSFTHIGRADRRDRMLLIGALTQALLTLLGAAAESAGFNLNTNTEKRRQLSLFNQGLHWYGAIPDMEEDRLITLMTAYDRVVHDHEGIRRVLGVL